MKKFFVLRTTSGLYPFLRIAVKIEETKSETVYHNIDKDIKLFWKSHLQDRIFFKTVIRGISASADQTVIISFSLAAQSSSTFLPKASVSFCTFCS